MPEQVTFIPYEVVAAAMAINHRLAGGVVLEKIEPPLETEWVRPIRLSRLAVKNHQPYFVFKTAPIDGFRWKVTMRPDRSDSLGLTGIGIAKRLPVKPPKSRTTKQ